MKKISTLSFFMLLTTLTLRGQTSTVAFTKVYSIFQSKCVSCHSNAQKSGQLDLEGSGTDKSGVVFTNLVNKTPANTAAAAKGHKIVYPGRADRSFLFHKVNGDFDKYYPALTSSEGTLMPQSGVSLTKTEKEIIRQWILFGATKTATIPEGRIKAYYDTLGKAINAFETPPAAPAANEGFQIKMGPFFLAPQGQAGNEVEYYQKWELNMANNIEVNRIDHIIANYSHHFIIYNYNAPSNATSIAAGLRLNAYHNNVSLVSAVQERTDLKLPARTAFKWPKDRVLDLNTHYINYSSSGVYKAEAYLNIYTQPSGTAKQEMYSLLLPNNNISIPNNGQTTTIEAPFIYAGKVYLWGLMGHTHKYGTGYKVFKRLPNGAKGELMYDASCPGGIPGCASPFFDYQHIPLRYFSPLKEADLNPGFVHQATWKNTGDKTLTFGPTSDDEMMVMIAMYTLDTTGLTSARDVKEIEQVLVYPNPMKDKIHFMLPPSVLRAQIELFDLLGRSVYRKEEEINGQNTEILRGSLPTGMYIFRIEDQRGYIKTGKIRME
jgi:Secretion system C-terminal sorting domain